MARTNLGQLLGNLSDSPPAPPPATPLVPSSAVSPESRSPVPTPKPAPREASARKPTPAPSYLRFVRKDTRLREDQLAALTVQARRLNRAKHGAGARLTENSLIRIAVDLMLERIENAEGSDEDEIRRALA